MRVLTTISSLRCYLHDCHQQANNGNNIQVLGEQTQCFPACVGLVPTMGALHSGHLSLIQRAREENYTVVVSIFVNPLQFGPQEDYQRYPRTWEGDKLLCEQAGVDAIFAPSPEEMGISGKKNTQENQVTQVLPPSGMINGLCASYRPGHFQGVTTIVTKLFNVVQPDRAYFGKKDGQQLAIIKRLVADLNFPIEIIACPTVREASGLALSSRNQYLTDTEKEQAALLYQGLVQAETAFRSGIRHSDQLLRIVQAEIAKSRNIYVEYIELVEPSTLMPLNEIQKEGMLAIAARIGNTRLIDNTILSDVKTTPRQPIVAIDGPAGAGKSTVAKQVATRLGLVHLDTGSMYRAITWLVLKTATDPEDQEAIAHLVRECKIELIATENPEIPLEVWINNHNVTGEIRSGEVTAKVSVVSGQSAVRQFLVREQQKWGEKGGLVAEGRDIGTDVFPDAEVKIFLTASVEERARRRQQDFIKQGRGEISLEQLQREIQERDEKDSTREISPLRKASDALEIISDGFTAEEVTEKIVDCYYSIQLHSAD
ncbi:bifunctional pantoate--beta-alanine ligase/(d)CMP kinase [Cylindrospermopsis raciborskii]|uniref:Bifunctional pantoate ligase/cytidylate kinase n=1 Tax=Cylindrospermopsis raciborskii CENA302 TaxID=1170768 RepID=A0A9Q5W8J7_9CYAN|nr:bifunctional pantoate--beta-alanine ligase/(d)CMP kinase [Cylindrospermopsis raciborskii]NLQ04479.1 bifunctional pantoate--beta-alanine ligase/(d)CMP kinase [Cylindrospermopsis raciborskii MVCC19]OHY34920.1 cytidylate kinase [Cylindrospermopsis raciborskii MVCC14]OPH09295.1 cytidylate kinase [Cylindrospermopsis raciborskii CENA302]